MNLVEAQGADSGGGLGVEDDEQAGDAYLGGQRLVVKETTCLGPLLVMVDAVSDGQLLVDFLAGHANYDTAAALSCHRTTLRDYILRLEHELGETLVQRARHGRPLSLTNAGRDVLTAIENARSTVPVRQRPTTHRAEATVA